MTKYVNADGATLIQYPYTDAQMRADNKNVSFPRNISNGIRANYNMYPVVEVSEPAGDIVTEADPTYDGNVWTQAWTVESHDLATAKSLKKTEIRDRRIAEEEGHPTIDTTRGSQAMINGVWSAAQINPSILVDFKGPDGNFVTLDANAIYSLANAVVTHVQACFSNEKVLNAAVDAAVDRANLDLVDLNSGWPTYGE